MCQTSTMDKRLHAVETNQAKTNEDIIDIQARSMRDNLIFTNIEGSDYESNEETEMKLRSFL